MSLGLLYVLLGEVFVQVLCPFYNQIICLPCIESYEFFIYFGGISLGKKFSNKFDSLFILMLRFFSCAKAFYFNEIPLFILFFMSLALGDMSVRMLLCGITEIFLPMFSSRNFMVS